ncbi:MAG: hypothetical protein ACFFD4_32295 [Candidatus Odinarchaeota archaeon]
MDLDSGLTEEIRKYCADLGVDVVGFADPELFNRFPRENRPEFFLETTKTVIVIGIHLDDLILDTWYFDQESGKNFQFADSILNNYCYRMRNFLIKKGYSSKVIPYSPGFFLKDSAALAGIGFIGKNNLLITEKFGPQIRLRALVTAAPLEHDKPVLESKYCENCSKCIDACPAKALKSGKYSKDACYPYQISHLRQLSAKTAVWCNICIDACPVGKRTGSAFS